MADTENKEYLDKEGLSTLWERIKQLVYECGCSCAVTYELKTDGDFIRLIGSDGSESAVPIPSGGGSSEPFATLALAVTVDEAASNGALHSTIELGVQGGEISNARLVLERGATDKEVLKEWNFETLGTGGTTIPWDTPLNCPEDSGENIPVTATLYSGSKVLNTASTTYTFHCAN